MSRARQRCCTASSTDYLAPCPAPPAQHTLRPIISATDAAASRPAVRATRRVIVARLVRPEWNDLRTLNVGMVTPRVLFEFVAALGRGAEQQRDDKHQQPAQYAGAGDDQHRFL